MSFFLRVSLGHLITVGFAELIFTSLIQISALNPKSSHYVTLATPRIVLLARVTLPAELRQLAHQSCLTPRDRFAIQM